MIEDDSKGIALPSVERVRAFERDLCTEELGGAAGLDLAIVQDVLDAYGLDPSFPGPLEKEWYLDNTLQLKTRLTNADHNHRPSQTPNPATRYLSELPAGHGNHLLGGNDPRVTGLLLSASSSSRTR